MKVIGAGHGRTGTASLKLALETLLGEPCYHMYELFNRRGDVAGWQVAADGGDPDWHRLLDGWGATVDWPASAFYADQAAAFPEAKVLLSHRDPASWWRSATATIFKPRSPAPDPDAEPSPIQLLMRKIFADAGVDPTNEAASIEAFKRHNERVRATIAPDRVIEWQPGDGWGPICGGLGIEIPDVEFPHSNSTLGFSEVAEQAQKGQVERVVPAPPATY